MIFRIVEYGIECDNPDCPEPGGHVSSWHTRAHIEADAPRDGWVQISRKEWLCKRCAAKLLPAEALERYRAAKCPQPTA